MARRAVRAEVFTPFAPLTSTALDTVDQAMPDYADEMLTRLEGMGGPEENPDDLEVKVWQP